MSDSVDILAAPRVYLEIYPHEGGAYAIEGGKDQVLSCATNKGIKDPEGAFQVVLAPGGPSGPNVGPSWLDIITPMSFVKIAMTRGSFQNIIMLGVVTNVSETWDYSRHPVQRRIVVIGKDIGYFFTHFSWYALAFINGPALASAAEFGSPEGAAAASAGQVSGYGNSLFNGSPDEIGKAWYLGLMDGPKGILSRTWFDNALNSQILFSDAVTIKFEKFSDSVKILWAYSFISAEETWWQKFNRIFPWPWYEFFVMTAPADYYDKALTTSWNEVSAGSTFSMEKLPNLSSRIYVIARVNPLPVLQATSGAAVTTFGNISSSAWNGLREFPENTRLVRTREEFSEEDVRNFYVLNPMFMKSLLGQDSGAVTPPMLGPTTNGVAMDPASIHRYGFRPVYMETEWFSDPTGQIASQQGGGMNFPQVIADLLARLASQYEPVALMMRAERVGFLRPDIIPGSKITYQPLKEVGGGAASSPSGLWTFYVERVVHQYVFGGPSTTTLTVDRGLPVDVYADTGLLEALHKGEAERISGKYQKGIPSSSFGKEQGLIGVSLLSPNLQELLAQIAPIYGTANSDGPRR